MHPARQSAAPGSAPGWSWGQEVRRGQRGREEVCGRKCGHIAGRDLLGRRLVRSGRLGSPGRRLCCPWNERCAREDRRAGRASGDSGLALGDALGERRVGAALRQGDVQQVTLGLQPQGKRQPRGRVGPLRNGGDGGQVGRWPIHPRRRQPRLIGGTRDVAPNQPEVQLGGDLTGGEGQQGQQQPQACLIQGRPASNLACRLGEDVRLLCHALSLAVTRFIAPPRSAAK